MLVVGVEHAVVCMVLECWHSGTMGGGVAAVDTTRVESANTLVTEMRFKGLLEGVDQRCVGIFSWVYICVCVWGGGVFVGGVFACGGIFVCVCGCVSNHCRCVSICTFRVCTTTPFPSLVLADIAMATMFSSRQRSNLSHLVDFQGVFKGKGKVCLKGGGRCV